eukprot:3885696-Prymnesium_polylepis.1
MVRHPRLQPPRRQQNARVLAIKPAKTDGRTPVRLPAIHSWTDVGDSDLLLCKRSPIGVAGELQHAAAANAIKEAHAGVRVKVVPHRWRTAAVQTRGRPGADVTGLLLEHWPAKPVKNRALMDAERVAACARCWPPPRGRPLQNE